jgi:hypothetical protein
MSDGIGFDGDIAQVEGFVRPEGSTGSGATRSEGRGSGELVQGGILPGESVPRESVSGGIERRGAEAEGAESGDSNQEMGGEIIKLGAEQQRALSFLVEGKSLVEPSRICRISRQTLYRWMKEDAAFVAAYNRWCEQMHQSARSRLLGMADKATVAVERALENGDAKAALQLLRGLGVLKEQQAGSGDAGEMKSEMEWENHKRRVVEGKRNERMAIDQATLPL